MSYSGYTSAVARMRKPHWSELASMQGAWCQHPRYQGCVGHWLMAEYGGLTTYDLTGRPLSNGVLTNMDPATDWIIGAQGPGLEVDGVDDYVSLGNASTGDPLDLAKSNDSFTLLVRFVLLANATADHPLIKRASGNSAWAYVLGILSATGNKLDFQLWGGAGNPFVRNTTALALNTLYSAAAVRDHASGVLRMYLNGLQEATAANNAGNFSQPTATELGRGNIAFTAFFRGQIHEVRIYTRALTPAEILSWHLEPYLEFIDQPMVGLPHAMAMEDSMAAVYAWQQAAEFVGVQYV